MSFKTFFFLVILLGVGVWGYLRYQASGDMSNSFNQTKRYSLGKSSLFRWMLNLHSVGDARGQYLADGEPIVIEVLTSRGVEINEEGLRQFSAEVGRITGRKTTIVNVDTIEQTNVRLAELPGLTRSNRRHKSFGQPNIFVIYAGDFENSDQSPARAFNEFGILVSDKKIKDLTSQYAQATREYLAGIMLHQFGYQIGLETSNNIECIMHPELLSPTRALLFSGKILADSYCDTELDQAQTIRLGFQ